MTSVDRVSLGAPPDGLLVALAALLGMSRMEAAAWFRDGPYVHQRPLPRAYVTDAASFPWTTREPREAWETLAAHGVIPPDWIDCATRGFYDDEQDVCYCGESYSDHRLAEHAFTSVGGAKPAAPWPMTMREVLAFASDVPWVLTTEALARQLAADAWPEMIKRYAARGDELPPAAPAAVV